MNNKALKQYIYEKYDLKVKRIGLCGPYYVLTYDPIWNKWCFIGEDEKYGKFLHYKLFTNVAEILDALIEAERYEHLSKNGEEKND